MNEQEKKELFNLPATRRDTFSVTIHKASFDSLIAGMDVLVKTGLFPVSIKTGAQAAAVVLAGQELGIMPMTALRSINIIQGKPVLSSEAMLAKFFRDIPNGQVEWIKTGEDGEARLKIRRSPDLNWQEFSFTRKEAETAGLLTKDNWKKYEPAMLRARTASASLRAVAPDSQMGLYTPDEMGAVVDENEIIIETAEYTDVSDPPATPPPPPPPPQLTLLEAKAFEKLDEFKKAKEAIGESSYYECLKRCGYDKSSNIPIDKAESVLKHLRETYRFQYAVETEDLVTARIEIGDISPEMLANWLKDAGVTAIKKLPATKLKQLRDFVNPQPVVKEPPAAVEKPVIPAEDKELFKQ